MTGPLKVCVFVDGENLRHSIIGLFPGEFHKDDYLPKLARWNDFYSHMVERAVGAEASLLRTYWYVVQYVDFFPYRLPRYAGNPVDGEKLVQSLRQHSRKHRQSLGGISNAEARFSAAEEIRVQLVDEESRFQHRFDGWQRIQDGIAGKHRAIEFRRAGAIQYNTLEQRLGKEKAVDVKLATDLVLLHGIYDVAIIVSGDQDYVPAVQAIKDRGKRVVNVAFERRGGTLLPGGARRLNHVTDDRVVIPYDKCKELLRVTGPQT